MPPKGFIMKTPALLLSLIAISALVSGCGTRGYNRADTAATSIQRAAARVDKGASQIETALAALADLVDNPGADLKPQFARFNASVNDLESLSKDVAGKSTTMQNKGSAYFQKWDEELARIQSEDIRSRSAARRTEVMQGFERVQANYQNTSVTLSPFLARLADIRTALSTDLTPAGLDSIRGSAGSARTEGASVQQSLRSLAADFKNLGVSLSPAVPQPQPASVAN
jgi:hypothetical protein